MKRAFNIICTLGAFVTCIELLARVDWSLFIQLDHFQCATAFGAAAVFDLGVKWLGEALE